MIARTTVVLGDDGEDLRLADVDQQDHDGDRTGQEGGADGSLGGSGELGQALAAGSPLSRLMAKIIRIAPV